MDVIITKAGIGQHSPDREGRDGPLIQSQCWPDIRAIQILHGHSKIENTFRYLGVDIEDAMTLAEKTEI